MAKNRQVFEEKLYHYTGLVLRVVDGDTLVVDFDFGRRLIEKSQSVRLARYNTAEPKDPDPLEAKKGKAASAFFAKLVKAGDTVLIKTHKDAAEKFQRILAEVWVEPNQPSLNQQMLDSGHGKPWDGKGRKPT